MTKIYYIYIITNTYNSVLYTGVTNNLLRRIHEHRQFKEASSRASTKLRNWFITRKRGTLNQPCLERNKSKGAHDIEKKTSLKRSIPIGVIFMMRSDRTFISD